MTSLPPEAQHAVAEPEPYLNPYIQAWFAPRQTYRSFRVHGSPAQALGVMAGAYLASGLLNPQMLLILSGMGAGMSAFIGLLLLVYTSVLLLLTWLFYPYALRKALRWMAVKKSIALDDLRYALAVGFVPYLGALFVALTSWSAMYLLSGEWFPVESDKVVFGGTWILLNTMFLFGFSLWVTITTSQAVGEAAGISGGNGFLALILSYFIVMGIVLVAMIAMGLTIGVAAFMFF